MNTDVIGTQLLIALPIIARSFWQTTEDKR